LDALTREGQVVEPVAAIGESYGAALALRWKGVDPRISNVVAIAPYAVLSNAVLNICHDYAKWVPTGLVKAGLRKLPSVVKVELAELDPVMVLAQNPVMALFVAGDADKIAPPKDVEELFGKSASGSELVVIPQATHEALPYYFNELAPPVLAWLERQTGGRKAEVGSQKSD